MKLHLHTNRTRRGEETAVRAVSIEGVGVFSLLQHGTVTFSGTERINCRFVAEPSMTSVLLLSARFYDTDSQLSGHSRDARKVSFCSLRCQVPSREAASLAVRLGASCWGAKLTY